MCTTPVILNHESLYVKALQNYQTLKPVGGYICEIPTSFIDEVDELIDKQMSGVLCDPNNVIPSEIAIYFDNAVEHWNALLEFFSNKHDKYILPPLSYEINNSIIPNPINGHYLIENSKSKEPFSEKELTEMEKQHKEDLKKLKESYLVADIDRLAMVYFAYYVIEDIIPLRTKLSRNSFWRLEEIWIKEVKELKAWLIWNKNGRQNENISKDNNYFTACWAIRTMLLNHEKGDKEQFKREVKPYLIEKYLKLTDRSNSNKYEFDKERETAKALIGRKANRIWETMGKPENSDEARNDDWSNALEYINLFYDNIITAVEEKDFEHTRSVLLAFKFSKNNRFLIINCFETAIAINFLDRDIIKKVFDSKEFPVDDVL